MDTTNRKPRYLGYYPEYWCGDTQIFTASILNQSDPHAESCRLD